MKNSHDSFEDHLSFFFLHKGLLNCLVQLILTLLKVRRVDLCKLNLCFDAEVKLALFIGVFSVSWLV